MIFPLRARFSLSRLDVDDRGDSTTSIVQDAELHLLLRREPIARVRAGYCGDSFNEAKKTA